MIEALLAEPRLALDTAPLIYFLGGTPARVSVVRDVLQAAAREQLELVISVVTEAELLVAPLRMEDPDHAVATVQALLDGPPAFDVRPISRSIARRAARIRADCNLRLADAMVAATAAEAGCTALLGNDAAFKRLAVEGLQYYQLDDLVLLTG